MTTDQADPEDCTTDCSDAVRSVHEFLDAELTEETRTAIQGHLDECSPCFKAFGFETDLRAAVADRLQTEIPAGLADRIRAAVAAVAADG